MIVGCSASLHRYTSPSVSLNFETVGKIGFSDGKKGGHAAIQWIQKGHNYQLRLYGPLGSNAIQIVGDPYRVLVIDEKGQTIQAKNPEAFIQEQFGWIIPVSGLIYWIRGLPAPGTPPSLVQVDDAQRIRQIKQQGWTISYQTYQSVHGIQVPYKLNLSRGNMKLKFIFRRWQFK